MEIQSSDDPLVDLIKVRPFMDFNLMTPNESDD